MSDTEKVVDDAFAENILMLYDFARRQMLLYRGATGDERQVIPPENFYDLPAHLRVLWTLKVSVLGIQITDYTAQVADQWQAERGDDEGR